MTAEATTNINRSPDISLAPPRKALSYKGLQWPTLTIQGSKPSHIFAIGDWGGLDGTLHPIEGRHNLIVYRGGQTPGPHVFPRDRWDKQHRQCICGHADLVRCFSTAGQECPGSCGFVPAIDGQAQLLVAAAFRARAAKNNPQYILNVGDNFYWGGIEKTCGTSMSEISSTARHQFDQVFEGIYSGPGLDNKPWFSVLGNHDWGGRVFTNGWDQQIAYSWASKRWRLPAPYWSQRVEYPNQNFSVDYFMLDSNAMDARDPWLDPDHNICSNHNAPSADCSSTGGPASTAACKDFFWQLWQEQQAWVETALKQSTAEWQIIVTHFPCGHEAPFYSKLHSDYGLDLLVTGHRHSQELWMPGSYVSKQLGGLACFVTGGGGGITSEASPADMAQWAGEGQYGFYDLTISKAKILIESINWDGRLLRSAEINRH